MKTISLSKKTDAHASFSHTPRAPVKPTIAEDINANFGGENHWKLPIYLKRLPGQSDVICTMSTSQGKTFGCMSANLKARELEELARAFLDAAHHLKAHPDF